MTGPATARAREVTSFSGRTLGELPDLVAALGLVKVAAARANGRTGALPAPVADALAAAASSIAAGEHRDALAVDPLGGGGAIAVHVNLNEVLASIARIPEGGGDVDLVRAAGASQSTADACHTAGRLAVLAVVDELLASAAEVAAACDRLADRFGDAPTIARTCLRDGLAVPARLLPDGWAAAIRRRREVLASAVVPLHQIVLGATVVGDGTGASDAYRQVVLAELAEGSGRSLVAHRSPASALQSSDDLVDVAAAVAGLAGALAKAAADLRLLASGPTGGFGEVVLPHVMEGSSFFAGKSNPVVPETVLQAEIQVAGHLAAARAAAGRAELHLNVFDLTAAVAVIDAARCLTRVAPTFAAHALDGAELDLARCAELAAAATPPKEAP